MWLLSTRSNDRRKKEEEKKRVENSMLAENPANIIKLFYLTLTVSLKLTHCSFQDGWIKHYSDHIIPMTLYQATVDCDILTLNTHTTSCITEQILNGLSVASPAKNPIDDSTCCYLLEL